MSYLARLKALHEENAQPDALTKPTKGPSVSSVSAGGEPLSRPRKATAIEADEIRSHLARLLPGEDHADFAEAYELALADPKTHLRGFREDAIVV